MATTTTKRGKTKTSKKTVSKASAKSNSKVKRELWTTGNLLGIGVLLSIALATAVGFLMQDVTYSVTLQHLTSNALLSQDGTSFITANRPVADLQLSWILVGLLVVSSILPVLYLTKLKKYYANRVATRRVLELRWIEMAFTSMVIVEVIGLLVGIQDLMTLKLMGAFMITTCLVGWLAERQNEKAAKPVWSAFKISVFTGLMPWVVIGTAKVATFLYGDVRSPWYVYAACVAALVGFVLLAKNQLNEHRRKTDYAIVERNYVAIGLATKLSFVAILLIGLAK